MFLQQEDCEILIEYLNLLLINRDVKSEDIEHFRMLLERLKGIRKGQYIFNNAYDKFPDECNRLRGTKFDCYYDDSKAYIFLEKLKELVDHK